VPSASTYTTFPVKAVVSAAFSPDISGVAVDEPYCSDHVRYVRHAYSRGMSNMFPTSGSGFGPGGSGTRGSAFARTTAPRRRANAAPTPRKGAYLSKIAGTMSRRGRRGGKPESGDKKRQSAARDEMSARRSAAFLALVRASARRRR
jgi:hypothetical protein